MWVTDRAQAADALSQLQAYLKVHALPVVTAVNPASGTTAGGTSVTITGTGFTGATAVHFGTAAATSFTVNSDTQITAISPAAPNDASYVDITVTTPSGTSAVTEQDQFGYGC